MGLGGTRGSMRLGFERRRGEVGAGTLMALWVAMALLTAGVVAVLWAAVSVATHRVAAAADLVALSAAQSLSGSVYWVLRPSPPRPAPVQLMGKEETW
jgi:hypothetical protein